jgi:hypothetical protein
MYKILATGAAVGLMTVSAHGVDIYAMNNLNGGGGAGTQNALIRFDSANPAGWVTIGATGLADRGFTGLDFHTNGNLYGYVGFGGAGFVAGLYQINVGTGQATQVGNLSGQALQDLGFNPADGKLYGINTVTNVTTLYEVNVGTGAVVSVGNITGLPATNLDVGLAFDAQGNIYIHDLASDGIYKGLGLNVNPVALYNNANTGGVFGDTNFSQGMTINWAGTGAGYHGAIGNAPQFFSNLRTFNTGGGSYTLVGTFGTSPGQFPTVETGDLAIAIPGPGAISLLAVAGLISGRRRRN